MKYEQSLKNINEIVNFIRLFDEGNIYFNYISFEKFNIEFISESESDGSFFETELSKKSSQDLPFARIFWSYNCGINKEILLYHDAQGIFQIDLISNTTEDFLSYIPSKNISPNAHLIQIENLIRKLEKL